MMLDLLKKAELFAIVTNALLLLQATVILNDQIFDAADEGHLFLQMRLALHFQAFALNFGSLSVVHSQRIFFGPPSRSFTSQMRSLFARADSKPFYDKLDTFRFKLGTLLNNSKAFEITLSIYEIKRTSFHFTT